MVSYHDKVYMVIYVILDNVPHFLMLSSHSDDLAFPGGSVIEFEEVYSAMSSNYRSGGGRWDAAKGSVDLKKRNLRDDIFKFNGLREFLEETGLRLMMVNTMAATAVTYLDADDLDALRQNILRDAFALYLSKDLIRGHEHVWMDDDTKQWYKSRFYFMDITSQLLASSSASAAETGFTRARDDHGARVWSAMTDIVTMFNDNLFSQRQYNEVAGAEFVSYPDLLKRCTTPAPSEGAALKGVWKPHADWVLLQRCTDSFSGPPAFKPLQTFTDFFATRINNKKKRTNNGPLHHQRSKKAVDRCPTRILADLLDRCIPHYDPESMSIEDAIAALVREIAGSRSCGDPREDRGECRAESTEWLAAQIGCDAAYMTEKEVALAALERVVKTARLRRLIEAPERWTLLELIAEN